MSPSPDEFTLALGVTGSRWGMSQRQKIHFLEYIGVAPMNSFHHGGCIGTDIECEDLMWELGFRVEMNVYPATMKKWDPMWDAKHVHQYTQKVLDERKQIIHEAAHPLERNKTIARAVDILLAYPGADSRGTYHAVNMGKRYHKHVIVTPP